MTATDRSGNATTITGTDFTVDTAAPVVSLTAPVTGATLKGNTAANITWTATDAHFGATPIRFDISTDGGATYNLLANNEANDGTYSWTTPNIAHSGQYRIKITATDTLGHATVVATGDFVVNTTAPTFTAAQMSITVGSPNYNRYVPVSLLATDPNINISHFCLKYSVGAAPAAPILTDACWIAANAPITGLPASLAQTLQITNYLFPVGFVTGTYGVYAWVKNSADNISTLTAAGAGTIGTDKATVSYNQGQAPDFSALTARVRIPPAHRS